MKDRRDLTIAAVLVFVGVAFIYAAYIGTQTPSSYVLGGLIALYGIVDLIRG